MWLTKILYLFNINLDAWCMFIDFIAIVDLNLLHFSPKSSPASTLCANAEPIVNIY